MLEVFIRHGELHPKEYAALVRWVPSRHAWCYLLRHHRNGLLRRHRDRRGRLVYDIGPNGARYLLWWKQKFPDAKVPE